MLNCRNRPPFSRRSILAFTRSSLAASMSALNDWNHEPACSQISSAANIFISRT
jgi:hypothetical protein